MKTGELLHAQPTVPESQKEDVFGSIDAKSFHGLGVAQTLSDHLEGMHLKSHGCHVLQLVSLATMSAHAGS